MEQGAAKTRYGLKHAEPTAAVIRRQPHASTASL